DHDTVSSPDGQTFNDIVGEVDVVVRLIGDYDRNTSYVVPTTHDGGGWIDTGGHPFESGSHSLRFTFSEPLDLVVKSNTVDPEEELIVYGSGPKFYEQSFGSTAVVTNPFGNSGNGLRVVGTGFGLNPDTGAAFGETVSENSRILTVTHKALVGKKFERIMVGSMIQQVPEPSALILIMVGLLTLSGPIRRK
ncbi:MAG: PEP-CTERM sorting domain-containing protein, partial [Planctomycetota bacterium]